MSQALALAVLAGVLSGTMWLVQMTGSIGVLAVLTAYFCQIPLMLAGLTMGLPGTLIAVAAAALINGIFIGVLPALLFLAAFGGPSLLVVRQALLSRQDGSDVIWYPPGMILAQLALLAVFGIALAFWAFMSQPDGIVGVVETVLTEVITQLSTAAGQPVPDLTDLGRWTPLVLAAAASSWLIMAVLNAVLAQTIAVRAGWNRRPSPQLVDLDLPPWLWPLMGVAVLAAMIGSGGIGMFGSAALIVLIVPFGFLGLAVIHKFANRWSYRQLGLAAVYVGIIVFNWPILAVVALGLVEDWAHLRRYM
ncbi:MAG: DUF2232 domain-containing protein [Pseudomonadota bacterium]